MLRWEEIDNEKTFQRLVNHLFALECNSPGFIPSSPHIGADEGWDGYYEGYYPNEKESGVWSIQSKWTTKSFKQAVALLRKEIEKELANAKRNKVGHLRIATNAELKVEQVKDLESLNKRHVKTLKLWHREELTRRIELQPFLKYYFFGQPQYPKFIPWNLYFEQIEKHLLPLTTKPIPKFNVYTAKISQFVASDTHNILLVHSPGGTGKSHMLRDLGQTVHRMDPYMQPWLVRQGHRKTEDAIQDEIISGQKYTLIFDDADRFPEEVRPLISFCKHKGNTVKLILAFRTSGLRSIYGIIKELRCEEIYGELSFSDWTKYELIQLLRTVTGKEKIEDEEIYATLYPNPFLIVWIGKRIIKEPTITFEKISEKLVNEIEYESEQCLKENFKESEVKDLLINLACIMPFSIQDSKIIELLSGQLGKKAGAIKEGMKSLVETGILREIGNSLRFNPDMKGDLYLAYRLNDLPDTEKIKELMNLWVGYIPEKLFANLGAATRYAKIATLETISSEIIDSWIRSTKETSALDRKKRLSLLDHICVLVPAESLSLINSYLDTPPSSASEEVSVFKGKPLTTDDYGPIILNLREFGNLRRDVLEVIAKLKTMQIEGVYSNYKSESLIQSYLSPLYNPQGIILDTLELFDEWLNDINPQRLELIAKGLSEILAGSHEFTKSTIEGMTFGEKILRATPAVREIRMKSLEVLRNMINHRGVEVKIKAMEVAEAIGGMSMGSMTESDLPISKIIAEERREVIKEIVKYISPEADYHLLSAIENLFMRWWAQKEPGTSKLAGHLRAFPRAPEYLAFRYYTSPEYTIKDFDLVERAAPKRDRRGWFIDNYLDNENVSNPLYFGELVRALSAKYDSKENIVHFLGDLYVKISGHESWQRPAIIRCWIDLKKEVFLEMRGDKVLWEQVPERFKNEIDMGISEHDSKIVMKLAEEILPKIAETPTSTINTLLSLIGRSEIRGDLIESWLSDIVEKGNPEQRVSIMFGLYPIFEQTKDINLVLRIMQKALCKEEVLSVQFIDSLSFSVWRLKEVVEKGNKELLDGVRMELTERLKMFRKVDWHGERLIDFAITGIDDLIGFVEFRLNKAEEIYQKEGAFAGFEAIPYHGLKNIPGYIKSFEDYKKLMKKIVEWGDEEKVYGRYYLEHLMKPTAALTSHDSGKLYIEEFIENQIEEGNIRNAIFAFKFVDFEEKTIALFLKVAEAGIGSGKAADIERLLRGKIYLETGRSLKPGEPPAFLTEARKACKKIIGITKNSELKGILERGIKSIDRAIKGHLKFAEEYLLPKS